MTDQFQFWLGVALLPVSAWGVYSGVRTVGLIKDRAKIYADNPNLFKGAKVRPQEYAVTYGLTATNMAFGSYWAYQIWEHWIF